MEPGYSSAEICEIFSLDPAQLRDWLADDILRANAWIGGVMSWHRAQWRRFQESYDTAHAVAGSQPLGTAFASCSMCAVIGAVGYVPRLAAESDFTRPWVALVLVGAAAIATTVAWRHGCRGRVGALATLLDNGLYSGALTYAAACSTGAYATGFAVIHGLMVLAFPALMYGLTPLLAGVLALPVLLALTLGSPATTVAIILVATYPMALALSYVTGKRRELLQAHAKLTKAVGAASQVADESVQAALGTTLLSLGNFLHELKNHQTAARANLAYIETSGGLDGDHRAALTDAIQALEGEQRLVVRTIDALKERAQPVGGDTSFQLEELLTRTADEAQGIGVELLCNDLRFVVRGRADHLSAVLHNLIRNSEQAGAQRVCMETRLEPSGQAVRITVHDDGPGIPESTRHSLFEPFGGTSKAGGTGLGLYLCRRYVELFGGSIDVEDSPLGGAAFVVRLPGRLLSASSICTSAADPAACSA